jgi:hypothetical protein
MIHRKTIHSGFSGAAWGLLVMSIGFVVLYLFDATETVKGLIAKVTITATLAAILAALSCKYGKD